MDAEKFDESFVLWISRIEMDVEYIGGIGEEWVEVETARLMDGIMKFSQLDLVNVNGDRCIRLDGDPERTLVVTEMYRHAANGDCDAMDFEQSAASFTVKSGDVYGRLRDLINGFVRSMYMVARESRRRLTVGNAVGGTGLVIVWDMDVKSEDAHSYVILVNEDMASR